MPEPVERKSTPTLILLILALLGLSTIHRSSDSGPESRGSSEGKTATSSEGLPAVRPREGGAAGGVLRPLFEHFAMGGQAGKVTDEQLLRLTEARGDHGLRCLIVTVADPVQTSNGFRFDEFGTAIQRAVESQNYVFDGHRFPWQEGPGPEPTERSAATSSRRESGAGLPPGPREPGTILFRNSQSAGAVSSAPLLLCFLVPETPTRGVDKDALRLSLELAETWDARNRSARGTQRTAEGGVTFNILGPTFSGSQESLGHVLAGWGEQARERGRVGRFEIISGGATAIDPDELRRLAAPASVAFHATVHRTSAVLREVLALVGQSQPVAMLVESNTAFGRLSQVPDLRVDRALKRPNGNLIYYPFPLQVSRLRSSYEKRGLLRDRESAALRSAEQLPIATDEMGEPRDVIAPQTPGLSSAIDELTLDQILTDIARRGIRTVGIIATNPLDVIFLAREVRRFTPDAQLFTTSASLLYTHAEHVSDLRGMLVGASYPLDSQNQSWSYSYRGDSTHFFFPSDVAQGTYNATVAQLLELGIRDRQAPPRFLEYGTPFDPPGAYERGSSGARWAWRAPLRRPPIWIVTIGYRGFYPVRVTTLRDDDGAAPSRVLEDDRAYLYPHHQDEEEYRALGLASRGPGGWAGDASATARRIRDWFRAPFQGFWSLVFAGISFCALTLVCASGLHVWWTLRRREGEPSDAFRLGCVNLAGLADFLNCCRPGSGPSGERGRGPGLYVVAALAILLPIYLTIVLPMIRVAAVPWLPFDLGAREFWFVIPAAFLLNLMVVSLLLSVAAWWDTAIRRRGVDRRVVPVEMPGPTAADPIRPTSTARARIAVDPFRAASAVLCLYALVAFPIWLLSRTHPGALDPGTFRSLDARGRNHLLDLERVMAVSSGVSPVFPMIFLGLAGGAWIFAQLKRRSSFDRAAPESPDDVEGSSSVALDSGTLARVLALRRQFDEALNAPIGLLWRVNVVWPILLVLGNVYFLGPVVRRLGSVLYRTTRIHESLLFEWVSWVLFSGLFVLLTFHAFQLVMLWSLARAIMKEVLHLPIVHALGRIPSRVAGWFFETPGGGGGRSNLVSRQANALADQCSDEVRDAFRARVPDYFRDGLDRWEAMKAGLVEVDSDWGRVVKRDVLPLLEACWSSASVIAAFSDEPAEGANPEAPGLVGGLRQIALAIAGREVPAPPSEKDIASWTRQAEDLVALLFLRRLAASLSQIWTLIGFLVVGAPALLLAMSSYPYPLQRRLMLGLGLLIAFLAFWIIAIVVGLNRDELISRLSNTAPNRLKVDGTLVANLVTYVVPLVGVLAALSFEASDTIRTLFDPIIRQLR